MWIWKTVVTDFPFNLVEGLRSLDADLFSMKRSAGQNARRDAERGRVTPVLEVFGA
ncbi:hypothetical protein AAJCM20276_31570 [Acetobacter aceti]|uniref:Uncharacterized protein n=1 Tax=Acetobacter aceti TaxID=435 RepID=A0A6S6PMJ3_ACEAC|nr:hypothetical protein AAJCM20276_31570 [Acetobacter aceti]